MRAPRFIRRLRRDVRRDPVARLCAGIMLGAVAVGVLVNAGLLLMLR